MLTLDHLAVASATLEEGIAWVEEQLGVQLLPGGQHARYGTHNALLALADGLYFEVIAKDPNADPEAGHSWFGLDGFKGVPRLANWICQTKDIAAAMNKAPPSAGTPQALTRGDLAWQIAVPDDGTLPFDGAFPTLLQWAHGTQHPSQRLADSGCKLQMFEVTHPAAEIINAMIDLQDDRVRLSEGPFAMQATFQTPHGIRTLA